MTNDGSGMTDVIVQNNGVSFLCSSNFSNSSYSTHVHLQAGLNTAGVLIGKSLGSQTAIEGPLMGCVDRPGEPVVPLDLTSFIPAFASTAAPNR